ncbi:MAG: flagellar motor stator protein MotA [Acidobacteriaceae bacterium]
MASIIGTIIVFGAILAGFLMEKGPLAVLLQPSEFIIICGAGLGTLIAGNQFHVLKSVASDVLMAVRGSPFNKQRYLDSLRMMFHLFNKARKEGMVGIEDDIEEPDKSALFSKHPAFLKDHQVQNFVCDTMRMAITGGATPFDVDRMMELDLEIHHAEALIPSNALATMADAMPGIGIVAAVLGIVIAMSALGGPPEEIGKKVAAALVGTFLGILMCYGVVGPMAAKVAKLAEEELAYYHVLRVVMLSFLKGMPPIMAVEMARRAIPQHLRPSFQEVEKACRSKDEAGPVAAVAA